MTFHWIAGVSAALKSFGLTNFIITNKFTEKPLQTVIFTFDFTKKPYLYEIVDKSKINCYTCTIKRTSLGDIMRIVNFSEARNNLKTVLNQVVNDADYTIITRRDSEDAVVMSLETFNSFMETFYLLRSPANAAHLTKSIQQFKNGKVQERDLINE
jgi:antitoxin YefM